MENDKFMMEAIRLAMESVDKGGGPFGAVIVKNGEIIASAANSVTGDTDPTAHAEVNAIRKAAKKLNHFELTGCEIYTSCEPCPMCLGAIYWARLDRVYFAANKTDAKHAAFDDSFIYDEMEKPYWKRKIKTIQLRRDEALKTFQRWNDKADKIRY
ncbi:MAG: nucleoside deaminase [Bacteroidota bacterium]